MRWHTERVKRVDIAARRQNFRRADHITTGHGGDKLRVQRGHQRGQFVVSFQMGFGARTVGDGGKFHQVEHIFCIPRAPNDMQTIRDQRSFGFQ